MTSYPDFTYLTEENICKLLSGCPDNFIGAAPYDAKLPPSPLAEPSDMINTLGPLQEPQLIAAIYYKNYPGIYRKLKNLTQPLPPADAMAACLCALNGTKLLMNRVLDHCPPIPQFQFQGPGLLCSLIEVTVCHNFTEMLDILLKRGADPNCPPDCDPEDSNQRAPLASAFHHLSYHCLLRLLEEPSLDLSMTEEMLNLWGMLQENSLEGDNDYSPIRAWCCEAIYQRITGRSPFFENLLETGGIKLALPHQLRLRHALRNNNPELAVRLCREHPLDEEDLDETLDFFNRQHFIISQPNDLFENDPFKNIHRTEFLLQFLERCPQLLETPQMRQALCIAALSTPQPDERLQSWVKKLKPGLVQLSVDIVYEEDTFESLFGDPSLNRTLFLRWNERLPDSLKPALSRHDDISDLNSQEMELLLRQVTFTEAPVPGQLSQAARCALERAPESVLSQLLQGEGLLAAEDQTALLNACQDISSARRSLILPYIQKEVHYDL